MGASLQPDDESRSRLRRRLVLGACGAIVMANVRAASSKDIASVAVLDSGLAEDTREDFRADRSVGKNRVKARPGTGHRGYRFRTQRW